MMLALILLQAQAVTFEHPCASASVVLEALGKEVGVVLRPTGSVTDDYFLVRFDRVPVEAALSKIAEVLNAAWTEKGAVRYLGRTKAQEDAGMLEVRKGLEALVEEYVAQKALKVGPWNKQRAVSKLQPLIGPSGELDRAAANTALGATGPCRELLDEFVRLVGAKKLASLPFDKELVFRWSPEEGNERIPIGLRTKAETTASNIVAFGEAARSLGLPLYGDFDLPAEVRLNSGRERVTPDFFAFRVRVSYGSVYVSMTWSGPNPMPYAQASIQRTFAEIPDPEPIEVEGTYVPSGLATAYCRRVVDGLVGRARRIDPASDEGSHLFPWLAEDMTPDMCQLGAGEAIQQLASALRLNVVAYVSDTVANGYVFNALRDKPLKDVAEFLTKYLGVVIDKGGGWMCARRPYILLVKSRLDRGAVSRLAESSFREGWPRVDALAAFAAHCPSYQEWQLGRQVATVLQPSPRTFDWFLTDAAILSLAAYDALPSAAKKLAHNETLVIPFEDLPELVRRKLGQAFSQRGFRRTREGQSGDTWGQFALAGTMDEPLMTERDLNGSTLEVRVDQRDFLAVPDKGHSVTPLYGPKQVANAIKEQRENGSQGLDYSLVAAVTAERLTMRVRLATGAEYHFVMATSSRNSETQYVPPDQVPGKIGDELRAALRGTGG